MAKTESTTGPDGAPAAADPGTAPEIEMNRMPFGR